MSINTQGSKEWLTYRRTKITASKVAAIMGEDPWRTPHDIYIEMVEGVHKERTSSMEYGNVMEPYARAAYEDHTGLTVEPLVVEHQDHTWLAASLDGVTFDNKYIVEIKCPGEASFNRMKKEGVPKNYWIQMQAQLLCVPTAISNAFFAWTESDYFMNEVFPDIEFHKEILEKCGHFYHEHILKKVPPPQKYIPIRDDDYLRLEERLQKVLEIKKKVEEEEEDLKRMLLEIADGRTVEGLLTRVNTCSRKGAIDEQKLKQMGLNMDLYRKPSTEYQTVSFIKRKDET